MERRLEAAPIMAGSEPAVCVRDVVCKDRRKQHQEQGGKAMV